MLRRDRRRVGRAGDLRDEAAVLAERVGEALARAGRALVDARADRIGLVGADRLLGVASGWTRRPWPSASDRDVGDRRLGHGELRRRDGEVAQPGVEQRRDRRGIAAGVAAQADRDAVLARRTRRPRRSAAARPGLRDVVQMPRRRRCRAPPPSRTASGRWSRWRRRRRRRKPPARSRRPAPRP